MSKVTGSMTMAARSDVPPNPASVIDRTGGPFRVATKTIFAAFLTVFLAGGVMAATVNPDMAKTVGETTPLFAAATSQDSLLDYNRDVYGRHHLVLTFFPAAFTPV